MVALRRVCIYFGDRCNLCCRYCFRRTKLLRDVSDINVISDKMVEYLRNIDTSYCRSLVANGGEPLLYFEKIKEVFNYCPLLVHKKIMTNGTLLTREIVDYCNDNNIEVCLSHDGEATEYLRGVDVLKDDNILSLLKQIKDLNVNCVVTNKNCDVFANYNYIKGFLERDFHFLVNPINTICDSYAGLVENFDYGLFKKSYIKYKKSAYFFMKPYYIDEVRIKSQPINLLLNGDLVENFTLRPLHVDVSTSIEVATKMLSTYEEKCDDEKCSIKSRCMYNKLSITEHMCRLQKISLEIYDCFN